jgi:hypothetical protein
MQRQSVLASPSVAAATTTATPVFDPRYNRLLINLSYLRPNNLPGSRDMTLRVRNGEGQVWLDPATTPVIGTVTEGRLVIASENFPRYAPLSMTLTGADLMFHVRQGRVLSFGLVAQGETLFRLLCANPWLAAYRYELRRPAPNRLILSRFNQADEDRETQLEINVVKGADPDPITGQRGGARTQPDGKVLVDKVLVRRADDGELRVQLHGARMEWDFAAGVMSAFRVYDSRGIIGAFSVLGQVGAGVGVTVSFLDTIG